MKHVLIVTASSIQKTESFIHIQAAAIQAQGWRVSIAAGGDAHPPRLIDGIEYVSSPLPPPARPVSAMARVQRILETLWLRNREPTPVPFRKAWQEIIGNARPDLIFVQFGPTAARLLPLLRASGRPWVVQFHGYDATQLLRHWGYRLTVRQIVRQATAIFGCSRFLAGEVAAVARPADRSKVHVVSPGYDATVFRCTTQPTRINAGTTTVTPVRLISVARLTEGKGHHLVLKALARCSSPLVLDIIGEGDARPALEAIVRQLDISGKVNFLGHQPHDEILARMNAADIFVQASTTAQSGWREGLGLSSVEAAATGLPVIVTNSGGLAETCCAESGLVVPDGDIAALADAIDTLANDPDLRIAMGQHGARFVRQHFLSNVQAKIAVAHFSDCLASAR